MAGTHTNTPEEGSPFPWELSGLGILLTFYGKEIPSNSRAAPGAGGECFPSGWNLGRSPWEWIPWEWGRRSEPGAPPGNPELQFLGELNHTKTPPSLFLATPGSLSLWQ